MAKYNNHGYITELDKDEIFVFGSNGQGNHEGGAALTAVEKFGAIMGQTEGLQGQSYAINTMDGEKEMFTQIDRFLEFAKNHPELTFLVTEIGCGIAGYKPEQVAPHFERHSDNVILPEAFKTAILSKNPETQDKARGMLAGLAIGDALGAPVQFGCTSSVIIENIDEIRHMHKNYVLPKGVWTDDTSMALCIADSLLECGGYDSYDIMDKYCDWEDHGYRSYYEYGYDEGSQTAHSLSVYRKNPIIPKDAEKEWNAGNGSIMRLAPIVIVNQPNEFEDIERTIELAKLSCRETHNSIAAEAVTEMFAIALHCAMHDIDKNNIIKYCEKWLDKGYLPFLQENKALLFEHATRKDATKMRDLGGYVVDAFAISLWGLLHFDNFEDGMLAVLKLGGDTDTNGAIYGQLAGAYYGYESIPQEWRDDVYLSGELVEIADNLLEMDGCPIIRTRFEDDEYFVRIAPKKAPRTEATIPESLADILKKHNIKKSKQ